ncbi:MAG: hypothetical protein RI894_2483 [Bacteroidota bacterium]|jgi:uncharacterized protein (DUF58 family)
MWIIGLILAILLIVFAAYTRLKKWYWFFLKIKSLLRTFFGNRKEETTNGSNTQVAEVRATNSQPNGLFAKASFSTNASFTNTQTAETSDAVNIVETSELLKKVRKIEIKTRGLSQHLFSGDYHSTFKGRGMSFSEVRGYQYGDDVRNIDWNVTARAGETHVKVFEEERELTTMLLIDVSGSSFFGSVAQLKSNILTEICAVLAFSAINNNDKVGVIFFSDKIEKFIPPKKGKKHILLIIRDLLEFKPEKKGTDIAKALQYLNNVCKKRAIVFVLSDFSSKNYDDALRIAARRHDVIGINLSDKLERELPDAGLIRVRDAETEQEFWLDSSNRQIRQNYAQFYADTYTYFKNTFMKCGADQITMDTAEGYVGALHKFFKAR